MASGRSSTRSIDCRPDRRPTRFVVVSGIDAYPESPVGDDPAPMTESSPIGTEFLAGVSREMEDEAQRATALGVGVVTVRMGNVLARDAALMRYLALPVRLFLGGRLGSGQQWFTWVHIDDAVALFRKAIDGSVPDGILNATSPGAVKQIDFARAMGKALHRPTWFPAPGVADPPRARRAGGPVARVEADRPGPRDGARLRLPLPDDRTSPRGRAWLVVGTRFR